MEFQKDAKEQQGRNKKKNTNSDNDNDNCSPSEIADGPVSPANKLGEDELTLIFSFNTYWISTNDLLNFRLVNKNWRDAATTTLLRRDACKVTVKVKPTTVKQYDSDDDVDVASSSSENGSFIDNDRNKKENLNLLKQLTEIILNSSKFPASTFEIHTSPRRFEDYAGNPDLIEFFILHGGKIKTICHHGNISRESILNICFTYVPTLECLDLIHAQAEEVPSTNGDDQDSPPTKSTSRILPFKTLILPDPGIDYNRTESDLVHFLLSSKTSKLLCLADVSLCLLDYVLEEGKGDLVTSFVCPDWEKARISLLKQFCKMNPKLSKLTLEVSESLDGFGKRMTAAINSIIRSSQQSLQVLDVSYYVGAVDSRKFNIPPMQNLKTLSLLGTFVDDEPGIWESTVQEQPHPLEFEDGFPGHKYFPNLLSFKLNFGYHSGSGITSPGSYIRQFPKNSCSKVDNLQICCINWKNPKNVELDYSMFPDVFSNVRVLKFGCGKIRNLSGTLWKMRSLEFVEIYSISRNESSLADVVGLVSFVDQFFTGFSLDMCHKLQTERLPEEINNSVSLKFLQMKPSIRDSQNLKELQLKFSDDFTGQFASRVTGEYAFSKIPNTKFLVSYDANRMKRSGDKGEATEEDRFGQEDSDEDDDKIGKYEEMCFGSIKPYVQIIREKQHY